MTLSFENRADSKRARIAILGSSLIPLVYANALSQNAHCTLFEGADSLGGAWRSRPLDGVNMPVHNNIIVAANDQEEAQIAAIKRLLTNGGAIIDVSHEDIHVLTHYNPLQCIVGDFSPYIDSSSENPFIEIRYSKIEELAIFSNHADINGEKFNRIILPHNFSIDKIYLGETLFEGEKKSVVSKHIRARLKQAIAGPVYTEDFDEVCDRGGIVGVDKKGFIGRVRREMKSEEFDDLLNMSTFLKAHSQDIAAIELNTYPNTSLTDASLAALKEKTVGTSAVHIETRQFVDAFSKVEATLERHFGRHAFG